MKESPSLRTIEVDPEATMARQNTMMVTANLENLRKINIGNPMSTGKDSSPGKSPDLLRCPVDGNKSNSVQLSDVSDNVLAHSYLLSPSIISPKKYQSQRAKIHYIPNPTGENKIKPLQNQNQYERV